MIDREILLKDLKPLLKRLEDDMRERSEEDSGVKAHLNDEYAKAKNAERTAIAFNQWRDDYITQAAVAWILGCVFVRFIEDNGLVEPPYLSGPDENLKRAKDERQLYFKERPTETDRDYLGFVFSKMQQLPALKELFNEKHNPLYLLAPSADGAKDLLTFFQLTDEATGKLHHDFTDDVLDTRFLGDLYQDLSESAKKKYALLQTPDFVEEFILDYTLTPAVNEFGYNQVRMIDPTCGSGHFLLGGFSRLLALYEQHEPGLNRPAMVQRVLDSVFGVDVNPFAAAIAKFRLLVVALRSAGVEKLKDSPAFKINVATGDSLLHGSRFSSTGVAATSGGKQEILVGEDPLGYLYETEDAAELKRILGQQYHVVVGNPPYIIVRDRAQNQAYRNRFGSCKGKYSLAVPFMERFFELGRGDDGYVGMITSNSFMKREFGKRLIEEYIPKWDLTHVIDTAGAYIPGHGTPTVVIFGRNRLPVLDTLRVSLGIRGEPSTPESPALGVVWREITSNLKQSGFEGSFVSIVDLPRQRLAKHPWSLGGGGVAEVLEIITDRGDRVLSEIVKDIGIAAVTLENDAFSMPYEAATRAGLKCTDLKAFIEGEVVRDWKLESAKVAIFPYSTDTYCPQISTHGQQYLWPLRTSLWNRLWFRQTQRERGLQWFQYGQISSDKFRTPLSIAFAEIASHNHFVLDRGGKVFNRTAPVIKLPKNATEDDHLALLALLNSSVACFWMKQVSHQKQMMGADGIRVADRSKVPYQFAGTRLKKLPIPKGYENDNLYSRLLGLAKQADALGRQLSELTPSLAVRNMLKGEFETIGKAWASVQQEIALIRSKLVYLQEEIDFTSYRMFDLVDDKLLATNTKAPDVVLNAGMRPFEIIAGKNQESFTVPDNVPEEWPNELRSLWQRRINAIKNSKQLRLIEDPHYKRRWIGRQGLFNRQAQTDVLKVACENWLLERLEKEDIWTKKSLKTSNVIADLIRSDEQALKVIEHLDGVGANVAKILERLVKKQSVPALSALRYKDSGMRNRETWEEVWELQRKEDAIDSRIKLVKDHSDYLTEDAAEQLKKAEVGEIPVPPKYVSKDMKNTTIWGLRGKLDVPKERFVSFPYCERDTDQSLLIGWAGWSQLELAQAIGEYYQEMRSQEGWGAERLNPLLTALFELLPWIKQWHNELDPEYHQRMGDFFEAFVDGQARELGLSMDEIRGWKPPETRNTRRRRQSS